MTPSPHRERGGEARGERQVDAQQDLCLSAELAREPGQPFQFAQAFDVQAVHALVKRALQFAIHFAGPPED